MKKSLVRIGFKRLEKDAKTPMYAHAGDSGMDLFAIEEVVIGPREWVRVRTGIALELPQGIEAQIRPRSGLAAKHGVTVLNAPGTVDCGYRGEIEVVLVNFGRDNFRVIPGNAIAQMMFFPVLEAELELVDTLDPTERGGRGFGSTD